MKAIQVDQNQSYKNLKISEIPAPKVEANQVLLKVHAAGCNFFDVLMVEGKYQVKPPFPFVPGSEFAGEIIKLGQGVTNFKVGDRVFGLVPWGCYAEQIVTIPEALYRIPENMSYVEAAGFGMVYATSYAALIFRAELKPKEILLVHAAAGGVGLAAVQIGKALGAIVIGTAGDDEKLQVVKNNGADYVINYTSTDWVSKIKEITKGKGVDVVYDPVGGDVLLNSLKCMAWCGRLIIVGFTSGKIPDIKANYLLLKNISVLGIHWGAYNTHDRKRYLESITGSLDLFNEGKLKPVICRVFPLEQVIDALTLLYTRKSYGKVILKIAPENSKL
eukprot:TRINITY_DN3572_c0_g1_i1.p1 TRINITY_DN3572_c0_g1~~TRINITY_DN3572_c0_g1_i1.p1  ORF type:complete len:332 (-),score=67.84 TRINITY_DN3572_c0_g1_i1:80-1075(-)